MLVAMTLIWNNRAFWVVVRRDQFGISDNINSNWPVIDHNSSVGVANSILKVKFLLAELGISWIVPVSSPYPCIVKRYNFCSVVFPITILVVAALCVYIRIISRENRVWVWGLTNLTPLHFIIIIKQKF